MAHSIRTFGDPVLRRVAAPVDTFDVALARLADDMIATMYDYRGVGVAGPQVGVGKAIFVYDEYNGDGPSAVVNPRIIETSGSWTYDEGCLSVPGMFFAIERPARVVLQAQDLDGREVIIEGSELLGRILQHEHDHLRGELLLSRLSEDERKKAKRELRNRALAAEA